MTTQLPLPASTTQHLTVPGGEIAYDIQGTGPLVLLVPGVGDLRTSYRFLAPALVDAGYRVATTDLRGQGDSTTSFASYGDVETASDVTFLLRALGASAVIVGNSLGAGAAVIVAAEHPDLVDGLVLIGPYVRQPASATALTRLLLRLFLARPWAAAAWRMYLPKLYAGRRPSDLAEYTDRVITAIRRPGYARAFALTALTDHRRAGESLAAVSASALVVMGDRDPDFKDPRAEADWIGHTLQAPVVMVAEAGHYPQSQQPQSTSTAVIGFLKTVTAHA